MKNITGSTKINLSKVRRCNQIWEDMSINERGRICQKCKKNMIDFRNLSNEEVMQIHLFKTESVCGIYRKDQLEYPRKSKKTTKTKALFFTLTGLLFSGSILAQESGIKEKIIKIDRKEEYSSANQNNNIESNTNNISKTDSLIISGIIYDMKNKSPIIGAHIIVQNTKFAITTDYSGKYRLNLNSLPGSISNPILIYGCLGYESSHIELNKYRSNNNEIELNIFLEESLNTLSDFSVRRASLGRRIIRGIGKLFKKK